MNLWQFLKSACKSNICLILLFHTDDSNKRFMMNPDSQIPDAKDRLLAAAMEIFAEKGFKAATVREIVDKADANIAAVNYHFGDKERLYYEAVKFAHQCSAVHGPPPSWPDGTPPVQKLRDFIRLVVRDMTTPANPIAMQLLMRELTMPTVAAKSIVRDFIQPMAFVLRGLVHEILPHLDPHRTLMVGFSVIGQCLYYRQNRAVSEMLFTADAVNALTPEMIAEHITRFTLAALGHGRAYGDSP
jgi:TetR/AcrR family transcriptional regulator, regulator of cefoperazone and chloramphenicol sensitivity